MQIRFKPLPVSQNVLDFMSQEGIAIEDLEKIAYSAVKVYLESEGYDRTKRYNQE